MKKNKLIIMTTLIIAIGLFLRFGMRNFYAMSVDYYYNQQKENLQEEEYKGIYIHYDNEEKKELTKAVINCIPDKIIKEYEGHVILICEKPVNRILSINKETGKIVLPTNFPFGELEGLYAEYDEKNEKIDIQSGLNDDIFICCLIHEFGHFIEHNLVEGNKKTEIDVKAISGLTAKYSPLNNADHIYNISEAFAEGFMFYILQPEIFKESCEYEYNMYNNIIND